MSEIDFKALAAAIPKSEIKQRVQAGRKLDYITARTVMNRLDDVCGPANWRDEYRHVSIAGAAAVECTLYIRVGDEWIGKTDVGTPSNYEPEKGVYSDALKRAAVRWGIGRELYGDDPVERQPDRRMATGPGTPGASKRTAQEAPAVDADDIDAHLGRNGKDAPAYNVFEDKRTFDVKMWPKFRDVLIAEGLADNEFHATGRLYKVYRLNEEGAKYTLSDVAEAQKDAKFTYAQIAAAFQQRASAKASEQEAEAAS